jgi:DNA-binding LytR/AlgR family response regulator
LILGITILQQFVEIIPLITVFGIMYFSLLILWNKQQSKKDSEEQEDQAKEPVKPVLKSQIEEPKNKQEKISVKQGTEIHILKTDDIYYIESYGDYVLIYTEKNKFIKEQTMYHFESVLPNQFIRIHRSYIINTDYLIRLELFGKETYNIRLKNGISLKASKGGYKLLKSKLEL